MAKYTITHTCGHDHEYQLFGPHKDRARKESWLAGQDCPRCRNTSEGPVAYITRHLHAGADAATIDVINSFAVKESLKARGYRFGSERVVPYEGNDLIKAAMTRPVPSWYVELEPLQVEDEILWIKDQGWRIVERSGVGALVGAALEGKSEVVIAKP